MHAFSVAPFDQNLSVDGKTLSDDRATLGALGVLPESVILLKVRHGSAPAGFRGFSCVTPESVILLKVRGGSAPAGLRGFSCTVGAAVVKVPRSSAGCGSKLLL